MIPHSIQANLAALRRRERLLTFVWGFACWISIMVVLLLLCGFIDWLIDRERDTPQAVRVGLILVQVTIAGIAGLWFVLVPQIRWLPDTMLALWVEAKLPFFRHRLISAVQLNQPNAETEGMSKELITVVTREADQLAKKNSFSRVADHSRLKWTGWLLAPVVIVTALPFLLWPEICFALLSRQALQDVDIPHSVQLESISQPYWPIDDEIEIRYLVTGEFHSEMIGTVYVAKQDLATESYPLKFERNDTDPRTKEQCAIFVARVNPSHVDIVYWARLGDGRTKSPSEMKLIARPVIMDNLAWLRLPAYCGLRPAKTGMSIDERRYEQLQPLGEVKGIPHSGVRVQLTTQKPIKEAWIELEREAKKGVFERVKQKMTLKTDGQTAAFVFDLDQKWQGYRLLVADEYGFQNIVPPHRALKIVDEEKPEVTLLRDTFSDAGNPWGNFDVEGMPIKLGEKIRIPYACFGRYGVGKAQILYRVLKKHESSDDPVPEERWEPLTMTPVPSEQAGDFDVKTGVFEKTRFDQPVSFHIVPSPDPDTLLGGTVGGGRFFLATDGLINNKGKVALKSGDQIEYCVKVYAANFENLRPPTEPIPFGISETRVSTVMDSQQVKDFWSALREEQRRRIREVENREKSVLEGKSKPGP
jgi:hypothetical protein